MAFLRRMFQCTSLSGRGIHQHPTVLGLEFESHFTQHQLKTQSYHAKDDRAIANASIDHVPEDACSPGKARYAMSRRIVPNAASCELPPLFRSMLHGLCASSCHPWRPISPQPSPSPCRPARRVVVLGQSETTSAHTPPMVSQQEVLPSRYGGAISSFAPARVLHDRFLLLFPRVFLIGAAIPAMQSPLTHQLFGLLPRWPADGPLELSEDVCLDCCPRSV